MDSGGAKLAGPPSRRHVPPSPNQCKSMLRSLCVEKPSFWDKMTMSNIPSGGKGLTEADLKQCAPPPFDPPRCTRTRVPELHPAAAARMRAQVSRIAYTVL